MSNGHVYYKCPDSCDGCMFCNGGLLSCTVCKGGEGSLPTVCPGRPMTEEEQDEVYRGELDFIGGMWRRE